MNWKALTKTARRTLSRNSSKILLGFGIAGAFTAVGFAITARHALRSQTVNGKLCRKVQFRIPS